MTLIVAHQGKLYADRYAGGANPHHIVKLAKSTCGKFAFGMSGDLCTEHGKIQAAFSDWLTKHHNNLVQKCNESVAAMKQYLSENPTPHGLSYLVMCRDYFLHIASHTACLYDNVGGPIAIGDMRSDFRLMYSHYDDVVKAIKFICPFHKSIDVDGNAQYDVIGVEELV